MIYKEYSVLATENKPKKNITDLLSIENKKFIIPAKRV